MSGTRTQDCRIITGLGPHPETIKVELNTLLAGKSGSFTIGLGFNHKASKFKTLCAKIESRHRRFSGGAFVLHMALWSCTDRY